MPSSPYLDLLEALRTNCNLPEFPDPLPSTQLDLALENGPTVTIDFNEESQSVELFSEIGSYPPERELAILRKIASANFLWSGTHGGTLSIRPDIQKVCLAHQIPVLSINSIYFVTLVEEFAKKVMEWQDALSNDSSNEVPEAPQEQPLEQRPPLPFQDNFIRA